MPDQPEDAPKFSIEDVPDELPPHPDEDRLRQGERQLAETIKQCGKKVSRALNAHDRHTAYVELARLTVVADSGRQAMAKAIQDQMDQVQGEAGDGE